MHITKLVTTCKNFHSIKFIFFNKQALNAIKKLKRYSNSKHKVIKLLNN